MEWIDAKNRQNRMILTKYLTKLEAKCAMWDKSSMAHLHLGMMTYYLVNTIRYQLKLDEGTNTEPLATETPINIIPSDVKKFNTIHWDWREIMRVMSSQNIVTTTAQNDTQQLLYCTNVRNQAGKPKRYTIRSDIDTILSQRKNL
jgi:hypothetical protein